MCFSSDSRCLEHFQMSPVFIQRLLLWAARQKACVLTVGPISSSDRRCDETAYNLAELVCLENPRDGGAWREAIYGVAQSRTRLK